MKFKIVGSGGMYTTPLLNCNCNICKNARNGSEYDRRFMPSLYIEDIKMLIDTPEDIHFSLEKSNINDIDYISISHKDPDHVRGIRVLEEMFYDFKKELPKKAIKMISLPEVIDDINNWMGNTLNFYSKHLNIFDIIKTNDIKINGINIKLKNNFTNEKLNIINYVFEKDNKKLIYACCNSKPFKEYDEYYNADVLIISMVDLTRINNENREEYKFDNELFSIQEIIDIKNKYNIKKVICTHLDCNWSDTYYNLKEYEKKLDNIYFAYDGMEIEL